MTLRVYDTLSGDKRIFEPLNPGKVGIYLCGPTVYRPAHIGHAVGPVIFDVVKRYLSYKGYKVTWVVNVTDVEDKLIAEAAERQVSVMQLARELETSYVEAMRALGVKSIDHMPRASEHIPEIIAHIESLIAKGHGYVVKGDVYFDVSTDADYGKLTHRKPEEQFAGTREGLVHSDKRNPGDFALWKAAKPEEPADVKYDSPWGPGRPGWHIECSAMAMKYLGETFDMHGGGLDLKFPHHENEIAQAESATEKPFARFWLHNGLTRFNTKKISKSDPDFAKVMDSLQLSHLLRQHPPEVLRFLILQSHYRSPIEFSEETLKSAERGLQTFYRLFERLHRATGGDPYSAKESADVMRNPGPSEVSVKFINEMMDHRVRFFEAMDDDFNTAAAIAVLFDMAGAVNRYLDQSRVETNANDAGRAAAESGGAVLVGLAHLLGMLVEAPRKQVSDDTRTPRLLNLFVDVRRRAREAKQYALADYIRDQLAEQGVVLEDRKDETGWRIE